MGARQGFLAGLYAVEIGLVEPVCARCHTLLAEARDRGRKVKGKGETWFLGHGIGLFDAPGQRPW